jgi:hypothetical protein
MNKHKEVIEEAIWVIEEMRKLLMATGIVEPCADECPIVAKLRTVLD